MTSESHDVHQTRTLNGRSSMLLRERNPVRNTGCFSYQSLRSEERQCDDQKNQSNSEEAKAHAACGFLTRATANKACAKYNEEQAKQNRKRGPNCEMSPCIQRTGEEKDKAQRDTDHPISFRHRAEFSTPSTRRQSEENRIGQTCSCPDFVGACFITPLTPLILRLCSGHALRGESLTPGRTPNFVVRPFRVARHEAKASHYIDAQVIEHQQKRV